VRALNLVVVLALSSSFGCVARVPAVIAAPEREREGVEPLDATTLTAEPTPTRVDANRTPLRTSIDPPLAFPGSAAEPLRSEALPDGLEIHDYTLGSGGAARAGDRVSLHYVGQLLDGTEFDSTFARATPFEIELGHGRMIPGMERGLEGVRVGMQRTLVIPPALAYGDRQLNVIPAHATLVFHVEVLSVIPPPPPPP
jgi:hypothetical protein